jgi:transposase
MPEKKRKQYDVTPDKFIQAWQAANNVAEVAAQLGIPKSIVYSRASTYRKRGINIKKMKRNPMSLDAYRLNQLIEGQKPETGESTFRL